MVQPDLSDILAAALHATTTAGEAIIAARQSNDLEVRFKGRRDLVTTADLEVDRLITTVIKEKFPNHLILSEESAPQLSQQHDWMEPLWILDPIDGTTNYAHGHSHVGVSLAFSYQGVVQVGVVHCPFRQETFHAVKGGGAFCNDKTIKPTNTTDIEDALLATGFPNPQTDLVRLERYFRNIILNCRDLRRFGACSVDICWVANGLIDGYFEDVHTWDMAAACLIAREAGCLATQYEELPEQSEIPPDLRPKRLLVANKNLFNKIQTLLLG